MKYYFSTLCIVLSSLFIQSCDRYLITFNDRPIHQPPGLLSNFSLDDPALENCIRQTIEDSSITRREQLTRLQCTHSGITTLTGIDQFPYLTELDLSNNLLTTIEPLGLLINLQRLNLFGNPALNCDDVESVTKRLGADIKSPQHCSQ